MRRSTITARTTSALARCAPTTTARPGLKSTTVFRRMVSWMSCASGEKRVAVCGFGFRSLLLDRRRCPLAVAAAQSAVGVGARSARARRRPDSRNPGSCDAGARRCSPLRQSGQLSATEATLFQPAPAMRVRGSQNKDTPPLMRRSVRIQQRGPRSTTALCTMRKSYFADPRFHGRAVSQFANDVPEPSPAAEHSLTSLDGTAGITGGECRMHPSCQDLRLPRPRAIF